MTIREFFESKEKLAIHCDTEEKAIALLEAFDGAGKTWANGDRYTDETEWDFYREETCYNNRGHYTDKEWLQRTGCRIIEFEEIDLEQPKHIEGKTVEFVKHKIIKGDMLDVFDVLEECIRLLSIDGSNTKQQVKELLERLVDGNE